MTMNGFYDARKETELDEIREERNFLKTYSKIKRRGKSMNEIRLDKVLK